MDFSDLKLFFIYLHSAVSGEDAQDRSDRTILTPWVKFLWESYCQCLELLRTNAHVETLYHDIARMAFQFCLKYNRKTEFRKLCDKLRKHLEDICKLPAQVANVSISKPETQQLNLETRLFQLESAIQMELWQVNSCLANIRWSLNCFNYRRKLIKQSKIFTVWWICRRRCQYRRRWLITIINWLWFSGKPEIIYSTRQLYLSYSNYRKKWRRISHQKNYNGILEFNLLFEKL